MTALLDVFLAAISIIVAVVFFFFYSRGNFENKKLKEISIFFLLCAIYEMSFSYFIFFENLYLAAWAYILAIAVMFGMFIFAVSVSMKNLCVKKENRTNVYLLICLVGFLVVGIQIYDLRLPIIQENGLINWNINKLAIIIISSSIFVVAAVWAYSLLNSLNLFQDKLQKAKILLLAGGGISLGGSGLTMFYAYAGTMLVISYSFIFLGFGMFLAAFLIRQHKEV